MGFSLPPFSSPMSHSHTSGHLRGSLVSSVRAYIPTTQVTVIQADIAHSIRLNVRSIQQGRLNKDGLSGKWWAHDRPKKTTWYKLRFGQNNLLIRADVSESRPDLLVKVQKGPHLLFVARSTTHCWLGLCGSRCVLKSLLQKRECRQEVNWAGKYSPWQASPLSAIVELHFTPLCLCVAYSYSKPEEALNVIFSLPVLTVCRQTVTALRGSL